MPGDIAGNSIGNLIFTSALLLAFVKCICTLNSLLFAEAVVILQSVLVFFLAVKPKDFYLLLVDTAFGHADQQILSERSQKEKADLTPEERRALSSRNQSQITRAFEDASPLKLTYRSCMILTTASLNLWL